MSQQGNPGEFSVSNDTVALLSFDFLKQLATLALATAGGTITLLQTIFAASAARPLLLLASGLLVLAALCSLQAQQILVERLRSGASVGQAAPTGRFKLPRTQKTESQITILAFSMFGSGIGLLIAAMVGV